MKRPKSASAPTRSKRARKARSGLTKTDYERLAELRYQLRRFLDFSEKAAQQAGLTAQQHQALLAVKGRRNREAMTTGDLAERLVIRHHSAVGLIDRLVGKGLLHRQIGSDDRRQVLITPTRKADGLLARLSVVHRDELERLAPLLQVLLGYFDGDRKTEPARGRTLAQKYRSQR